MTNRNPLSDNPNLDQIGVVVSDLYSTAEKLNQLLGIGPFRAIEWPIEGIDPEATYHGEPGDYRLRLAFAQVGSTQLELIEPLEGPNIWRDFLESHGPGLHHIRFTVPDFEERVSAFEAAGIKKIASGTGAHVGSQWACFDTTDLLEGIVVELRKRLDSDSGEGRWATEGIKIGVR